MQKLTFSALIAFFFALTIGCKDDEIPVPTDPGGNEPEVGVVDVWRTNRDGSIALLKEQNKLPLSAPGSADVNLTIDATKTYQSIDGFGAALTGSSAYVMMTHLSASQRSLLLRDLFDPQLGAGINYLRLTMGASDFSLSNFSYNDLALGQTDPDMAQFSLDAERTHLIPLLKEIKAIAPELTIMATPWSAPAWMKDNQSMVGGGNLVTNYYAAYARYFVKYLQQMSTEGIEIQAITIQNEPLHQAPYPSMSMSANAQMTFIRDHLGPALQQAGLKTQIIVYDHNWDNTTYAISILNDAGAKAFVAGSAFHCYAGDVSAMSQVQQAHPDKGLYFTECSGGAFAPDFASNLAWNMENLMVGAPRNWSKCVLFWNLALDENAGPQNGGCTDCRGVVTVNSNTKAISKNVEYYLLAHTAKFVRKGAVRLETPSIRSQGITQAAYKNTDGSYALVAFNHNSTTTKLQVNLNGKAFAYTIQPGMLASFAWK